jgi:hypothetical protein
MPTIVEPSYLLTKAQRETHTVVRARPATIAVVVGVLAGLTGCQILGPFSISQGRSSYNKVIEETSKEQVFLNVVRVHSHAPTFFMDVSEVDAQVLAQGSVTGGRAALGAHAGTSGGTLAGSTGSVLGSFEYQEAPIIRYLPLQGQPLVQQIATPITVDSISYLSDSNWPLASILTFAVNSLTLAYEDYFPALNAIIELDQYGALVLVAEKSELTSRPADTERTRNVPSGRTTESQGPNDTLTLYLEPGHPLAGLDEVATKRRILHLWIRLLQIYAGTQPPAGYPSNQKLTQTDAEVDQMTNASLNEQFHALRSWIELRTAPILPKSQMVSGAHPNSSERPILKQVNSPESDFVSFAPLMRTRSALGILKAATEAQSPLIEFVSAEEYDLITKKYSWNSPNYWNGSEPTFYTLPLCDFGSRTQCDEEMKKVDASNQHGDHYTMNSKEDIRDYRVRGEERLLGHSRRYILVIVSDYIPLDAYVSVSYNGKWYYIAPDDDTSKMNFTLVAQFLTMQAVPPTNPPLTPSISVGRSGS